MRIVWLTDIHLNGVTDEVTDDLLAAVAAHQPAGVLLGGDIAEAPDVREYLLRIAAGLDCPVYFVLGNHDYYFGSVQQVRQDISRLCQRHPQLTYLTDSEPVQLSECSALVGHDGWADGRCGDYHNSRVVMSDHRLITELAGTEAEARLSLLQKWAGEAADHIYRVLPQALERAQEVLLLTHVPPFRAACWHEGNIADDQWAPHFSSQVMGETIVEIMRSRPAQRLTVLCGHTHSSGEFVPIPNVRVVTGAAEYGSPGICRVLTVS